MKEKKKKISRSTIVKKLDKIFSEFIRKRDDGICFTCGKNKSSGEVMTNGHLFSRVAYSTRWSELNCHCQCWGCNYSHEFDFERYRRKFIEKYGNDEYDRLYLQFRTPMKYNNNVILFMIEEYKQKVKNLDIKS